MKKPIAILMILGLIVLAVQGCTTGTPATVTSAPTAEATAEPTATSEPAAAPTASPTTEPAATAASGELLLTLDELAMYNGQNGNPAYIAVDGVIYDVTNVREWRGGLHNGFTAGHDLTEEIKNISPHGISKLTGLTAVGKLAE